VVPFARKEQRHFLLLLFLKTAFHPSLDKIATAMGMRNTQLHKYNTEQYKQEEIKYQCLLPGTYAEAIDNEYISLILHNGNFKYT
jgi:hypothetical protein